jgi:hypothetical protein
VGVSGDAANPVGPSAFRIGGDGTIRILDNANRRLLFFTPAGKPDHMLALPDVHHPVDFIVNPNGEAFILDQKDDQTAQVVRYTRDGKLEQQLPLGAISPDGINLTADQDLLVVGSDQTYWTVIHQGTVVAPSIQPLTRREGIATPRSPLIFRASAAVAAQALNIVDPVSDGVLSTVPLHLPSATTQFANVDRAMNLYFRSAIDSPSIAVVRVMPDGTVAGGAQIEAGCHVSWRQYYIDQVGTAWTLCVTESGVSVKRYTLQDLQGQPLPLADPQPADVPWQPAPGTPIQRG